MSSTFVRMSAVAVAALASSAAHGQFFVDHVATFGPAVCFKMNNSGQIAGDYQFMSLTTPMRYTPGVGIQARSTPRGSGLGYAIGMNNAGACIGQLDMPGTTPSMAVIWDANNVMTTLPMVDTFYSYNTGVDLNDSDVACGYTTQALVGDDVALSWRWDSVNGYTPLPNLTFGAFAHTRDINNSGVIVGFSANTESAPMRAVIWDAANQVTEIPLVTGATTNQAWAINESGVVVGDSNGNFAPWRYTPGTGVVALAKFGNEPAVARGINDAGWVVGYARQFGEWRTVVWDPTGAIFKLEDYAGPNHYFPSDGSVPIAISNQNTIVTRAYDFTVSGDPRAVVFEVGFPVECAADVTGDGEVNVTDLLEVISAWGSCTGCPADTNDDGQVNVTDLLEVISAWGTCD